MRRCEVINVYTLINLPNLSGISKNSVRVDFSSESLTSLKQVDYFYVRNINTVRQSSGTTSSAINNGQVQRIGTASTIDRITKIKSTVSGASSIENCTEGIVVNSTFDRFTDSISERRSVSPSLVFKSMKYCTLPTINDHRTITFDLYRRMFLSLWHENSHLDDML